MTGDDRPLLSVVVAATDSTLAVDRVLRALEGQADGRIEIIVVGASCLPLPLGEDRGEGRRRSSDSRSSPAPEPAMRRPSPPLPEGEGRNIGPRTDELTRRPAISWLAASAGSGVPRLRRIGAEFARGRIVAFTEDSCLAGQGWVEAWLLAFADPSLVAASGVVEHTDVARMLDWAVVFCEYAPFLPPPKAGSPDRLAGNNFAVLREVALRASADEVREVELLAAVLREGEAVRMVEGARVRHVRRFGWCEAFGDRLRFGLEFGRLRTLGLSPIARKAGFFAVPAIFAVQAIRLSRTILNNRRYLGWFIRALPITLALLAAWSVGEWAGWCLGPPARDRAPGCRRRGTSGRTGGPLAGRAGSPRSGCKPAPPVA
jgi:hypothetical protein